MKLKDLTQDQQNALVEYRSAAFARATCTAPADRPVAEQAARRMAEIAGVKISAVVWVTDPAAGKAAHDAAWDSLRASLGASLGDSLRASLRDSLRASLRDSLGDSLWDSLWASLRASLRSSLGDSLRASLGDSLGDSLWDSLGDSLWASGWLAFYAFPRDHLGVTYTPEAAEKLALHEAIAGSAFAIWIVPGTIILCERPETVEIVDGRLVGLTWRK